MTVPDEVVHNMVEQLRVSEERLKAQVAELRRVAEMHHEIAVALRDGGRGTFATMIEAAETAILLAAAEVEHGAAGWRRAVNRSLTDTQPIPLDVSLG